MAGHDFPSTSRELPLPHSKEIVQLLSREMIEHFEVEMDKESRNAGNQEVATAMSLRDLRKSPFPEFLLSCLPKILSTRGPAD